MSAEWRNGEYLISTEKARLDIESIHAFLTTSYWAAGIPLQTVRRSIEQSMSFGVYHHRKLVGFARVVTDYATFAYLADVFVVEEYRGRGLAKWLVQVITSHPDLEGLRRWMLATRDAHELYRKIGFTELKQPDRWMEKHDKDVYQRISPASE